MGALLDSTYRITSQEEKYRPSGCGGKRYIKVYCGHCGEAVPVRVTCGDRACPDCRGRERERLIERYTKVVKDRGVETGSLALVTLTRRVVASKRLRAIIDETKTALGRLRRREEWDRCVSGGMYTVECKQRPGAWYVHVHLLVESVDAVVRYRLRDGRVKGNLRGGGSVLRGDRLGELWHEITGDSMVVDITPVDDRRGGLRGGLSYILKYLGKSPELLSYMGHREYNEGLKGKRVVGAFGSWHGLCVPEGKECVCPECGCTVYISEFELRRLLREYRAEKEGRRRV